MCVVWVCLCVCMSVCVCVCVVCTHVSGGRGSLSPLPDAPQRESWLWPPQRQSHACRDLAREALSTGPGAQEALGILSRCRCHRPACDRAPPRNEGPPFGVTTSLGREMAAWGLGGSPLCAYVCVPPSSCVEILAPKDDVPSRCGFSS